MFVYLRFPNRSVFFGQNQFKLCQRFNSFQNNRQMRNFLFMETYSVFLKTYNFITSSNHTFTCLESCEFDTNVNRFIYKCSSKLF